ncbi:MAG TPA: M28 family peptidase [Kofleriaceae bacterium]|nr:M28 family peptidase [Kofleriaceae bacterium]
MNVTGGQVQTSRLAAAVLALAACGGTPHRDPIHPAPVHEPAGPMSAASMMRDVLWLCAPARRGRRAFSPEAAATADYIARAFASAGLEVSRQPIPGGGANIIGLRAGNERAVIVSAHYDHLGTGDGGAIYTGADDNASGVAVLLALARKSATEQYRQTLLFIAFGAEEPGLVGSGVYIRSPTWALDKTTAIINFDMVGRRFFESGANRDAAAAIIGLEHHPDLRRLAIASARRAGLTLIPAPARLLEVFGFDDRTDDWWFRRRGVLAIHFSTGMHPDYHRPTDTPDKLVAAQMERIARTAHALMAALAEPRTEATTRRKPEAAP